MSSFATRRCVRGTPVVECRKNPGGTLEFPPASKEAAMPDSQDLKEQLLRTDAEFRSLYDHHHELDERLRAYANMSHLSEDEQRDEVLLKKRKLMLKDRMEDILRRYAGPPAAGSSPMVSHA
jgi:uncharacterized protein YdcH (DUF465 family)